MKKYLLWAAGLYFLYRTFSSAKASSDGFVVPPEWMIGADGHITYTIPDNWFNADQKNVLKWAEKAMEWGVAMGMDPALIMGCIYSESSGNEDASRFEPERNEYSYGLMQILWSTALEIIVWLKLENYGISPGYSLTKFDIFIPNFNIMIGTRYLVKQYIRYSGLYGKDRVMAMFAAYNAGTARKNASGQYTDSAGNTRVNDYAVKCINAAQRFRFYLNNLYPAYFTMFPKEKWLYSGT